MGCDEKLVLIVDDEPAVVEAHSSLVRDLGYSVIKCTDPLAVDEILTSYPVNLVILDMRMPIRNGLEVLHELRVRNAHVGVVMATVVNDIDHAVRAIKSGAYNYLLKPLNKDRLSIVLESYFANHPKTLMGAEHNNGFFTVDPQFEEIFRRINAFAAAQVPVLIRGETGTGKELVAHLLHRLSPRCKEPFVAVNVAAISQEIFESEMFGHARGSFTGAVRDKQGYLEVAGAGTLFCDEIGEISLESQKKFLRVLQTKQFCRVGETNLCDFAATFFFATNRDLSELVSNNLFRQDLYFRLSNHEIYLPPLKERNGDIELLSDYFFKKYSSQYGRILEGIAPETINVLKSYSYPGNVRELEGIISSAVLLEQSSWLRPTSLPPHVANQAVNTVSEEPNLEKIRERAIFCALSECDGNQTKAAKKLGIARETLNRFLKSYHSRIASV